MKKRHFYTQTPDCVRHSQSRQAADGSAASKWGILTIVYVGDWCFSEEQPSNWLLLKPEERRSETFFIFLQWEDRPKQGCAHTQTHTLGEGATREECGSVSQQTGGRISRMKAVEVGGRERGREGGGEERTRKTASDRMERGKTSSSLSSSYAGSASL